MLGALCALGMVFSHQLVALIAPGFHAGKAEMTAQLTRIMFPFILLVSLAALVMGMLNAKSIFGRPAMASSFFNLGSIIGGVALGDMDRSALRTARARRPRDRDADRRRPAARGAAPAVEDVGIPVPPGFSVARSGRIRDLGAHGARR